MTAAVDNAREAFGKGDVVGAVAALDGAMGEGVVPLRLQLADSLFRSGERNGSVDQYKAALEAIRKERNEEMEGQILVGMAFTMLQSEDGDGAEEALEALQKALTLAEKSGHPGQQMFLQRMIAQAKDRIEQAAGKDKAEDEIVSKESGVPKQIEDTTLMACVEGLVHRAPLVLLMNGTPDQVKCQQSLAVVKALVESSILFDTFDVATKQGEAIKPWLKQVYECDPKEIPLIFLKGKLFGGAEKVLACKEDGSLEKLLVEGGAKKTEDGEDHPWNGKISQAAECEPRPCDGSHFEWAELGETAGALVELIAKVGPGAWDTKAEALSGRGLKGPDGEELTAELVQKIWEEVAPRVKQRLEAKPEMECGHSCNTCPTKDECGLHGALDDW
mmetsp:Transcript_71382/g.190257  ORF Transcript_71382/g.190257 Transcript_71382/m.190257 type:complete len:389 (-) Transcript_71382:77-1243(-)